jgi:hypothetical protein
MALLVAAMCSREKYQHACRQYAEKVLKKGSPLHTIAMLYTGQLRPPESGSSSSFWGGDPIELRRTWRIHLAAIISNRTAGWDRIVLSLGDRLLELGETHAAHFCYMVCGCAVASPLRPDARLTLLGCNLVPADVTLNTEGSIEAYTYTEAYEWAKRCGNPNAAIQSLQPFKLRYAMLLADLGYEEVALLYIKSILKCLGVNLADIPASDVAPGPLSLCILSADIDGMLASLVLLEKRLMSRNLMTGGGILEAENDSSQEPVYDEADADVSFLTAHSNIHDITHSPVDKPGKETSKMQGKKRRDSSMKGDQKSKEKKNKENGLLGQHLEPQMEDQVSDESEPASEQSSSQNVHFMAAKPPSMHQPPMASNQTGPPKKSTLTQEQSMASNVPPAQQQMPSLMQQPPMAATLSPAQREKPSLIQHPPMAANTPTKQPEKPPLMQQPPMAMHTPSKQPEKPPSMMQPPSMASSTPSREPQKQPMVASTPDQSQSNTKKNQVAPMSAPAHLEKNKESTPSPSKKSTPSSAGKSKCTQSCLFLLDFVSLSSHFILIFFHTHDYCRRERLFELWHQRKDDQMAQSRCHHGRYGRRNASLFRRKEQSVGVSRRRPGRKGETSWSATNDANDSGQSCATVSSHCSVSQRSVGGNDGSTAARSPGTASALPASDSKSSRFWRSRWWY